MLFPQLDDILPARLKNAPHNPVLDAVQKNLMVALDERKRDLLRSGRRLFDFGLGDPREPTPSFLREALRAAVPESSQYPSPHGTAALRAAAAGYLDRRFGVKVDPDRQVVPATGAKEAIFHLPLAFAGDPRRSKVVMPDPAYPTYEVGTRFAGLEPVKVPLSRGNRFLAEPTSAHLGIAHLIATECEVAPDGRFSGRTAGTPNMREGKLERLHGWLAGRGLALADCESRFYSDSINDLPLLAAVRHAVAVDPDDRLREQAAARGWPVISLR